MEIQENISKFSFSGTERTLFHFTEFEIYITSEIWVEYHNFSLGFLEKFSKKHLSNSYC